MSRHSSALQAAFLLTFILTVIQPPIVSQPQQSPQTELGSLALPATPDGTNSASVPTVMTQASPQVGIQSTSDFAVFRNENLTLPSAQESLVDEPSVAQKDEVIFYTGNWYAARSTDGGVTWTYINPFSDMPEGGFCCDQDTLYEPSRGIFLWYRQARNDSNGANYFKLGVSTDASSWFYYTVRPTNVNPMWTGQIFDFPILAFSDNYLYITTNMFSGNTYTRSLILRWSLDDLKNHVTFYRYYAAYNEGFTPVQGSNQTMYFATHLSISTLRLYVWDENSTLLNTWVDVTHPSFFSTTVGSAECPAPDGGDICRRLDDRVLGGWLAKGVMGFLWSVKQGGGFQQPYTYVIRINETTRSYINSPVIANPDYAWVYTWITPNARGDLALVSFTAGADRYPTLHVGVVDDLTSNPPPWQFYKVATSTHGPMEPPGCNSTGTGYACWGDFLRVRPYDGNGTAWVATGYTLEGGNTRDFVKPRYFVFGRIRDYPFNTTTVTFLTSPSVVGSITFNATTYINGQMGTYNLTTYTALANIPPNHNFSRWIGTGGVVVSASYSNPTNVTIVGTGNLTAVLIPPNITITFHTNPANGGTITCSGQTFINSQTGNLPANTTITCTANPTTGLRLSFWSGLAAGTSQTVSFNTMNGGILTASFRSAVSVTSPALMTAGLLAIIVLWLSKYQRRTRLSENEG